MNHLVNNKSITNLSSRLDKLTGESDRQSKSDGNIFWKGKKIVPHRNWAKIGASLTRTPDTQTAKEALQCFPDDYAPLIFPLGIPDGIKLEEANKWYNHYIELMEFTKNAKYGMVKCAGCLLNPEMDGNPIFNGFSRIMAKGLMIVGTDNGEGGQNEEETDEKTTDIDNKRLKMIVIPVITSSFVLFVQECTVF